MKKIIVLIVALLAFLCPQPAYAGSGWFGVGVVSNVTAVQVVDNPDYYRVNFTIETSKDTETFTALCPTKIAPTDIMFVEPNAKYRVRMDYYDEWYIEEFTLILEMDKTTKPPVKLNTYSMPSGIFYNRDATGSEWMIRVEFGEVNTPSLEVIANAVRLLDGELSAESINDRITTQTQTLMERWETYDASDKTLSFGQRIEDVGGKKYEVTRVIWFGFHIYSLDDPETPENELSFTTIFSQYPLPDNWWE